MKIRTLLVALSLSLASLTSVAETLKLGLNYPQSGRYQDQGLQQRLGAFLAVEEINQQGGILGQPVEDGQLRNPFASSPAPPIRAPTLALPHPSQRP